MELRETASGGRLGIWGTDGTAMLSAELISQGSTANLNFYPGNDWLSGTDTAISICVGSTGGRRGIWGSNGTHLPQVEMTTSDLGGRLAIWGTNGTSLP